MLADILRNGFAFAGQRPGLIFIDLFWKLVWTLLTVVAIFIAVMWLTGDLRAISWQDTGVKTTNGLIAAAVLRDLWLAKRAQGFAAMAVVSIVSIVIWIILEAVFRRKLVRDISLKTFDGGNSPAVSTYPLKVFLGSGVFKMLMLLVTAFLMLSVSFVGARTIGIVTFISFAFLLAVFETLIRADAVELFGTDLIRVAGLLGILVSFESMVWASVAIAILAGFLNVARLSQAFLMIGVAGFGVLMLTFLHSYLLLVRFSAIAIMRRNVIEV
jgi:hypothetical protein